MNRTVLIPQYMRQFSCIGSACEDTCCSGWQITIDQNTYQKYEESNESDSSLTLLPYLKKNNSNPTNEHFAEIKLRDSDSCCPLLNDNKLCSLHAQMGEDFLSNLCVTYPRVSNVVNGRYEKSATVSCPEAARLALLNPNGITFEEMDESIEVRHLIVNQVQTEGRKAHSHFLEYRTFTIQLLQNRKYSITERLLILGIVFEKVQNHINSKEKEKIPGLLSEYSYLIETGAVTAELSNFSKNVRMQLEIGRKLIDKRLFSGVKDRRYLQCLMETLQGIKYTGTDLKDESIRCYEAAYQNYYVPFIKNYEYILENYLVNYTFKNAFPIRRNVFKDYILLICHFALIKLHLIGLMGYRQDLLSMEDVIKLIQSFSRVVEHAHSELTRLQEYLSDNGFSTMDSMAILIIN